MSGSPTKTKGKRERIFVLNDDGARRINSELAVEIGLNESVFFLQLEFLLSVIDKLYRADPEKYKRHIQKGRLWVYSSLDSLREEYFPWWSKSTVGRIIRKLAKDKLVIVGNFNQHAYDRTQWLTINFAAAARLWWSSFPACS